MFDIRFNSDRLWREAMRMSDLLKEIYRSVRSNGTSHSTLTSTVKEGQRSEPHATPVDRRVRLLRKL